MQKRLLEFGPNALPSKKESLILKFLYFFWNPLSWCVDPSTIYFFPVFIITNNYAQLNVENA